MLKNIEYIEINKTKVMLSNFFIPLAAPIFLFLLAIFRDNGFEHFDFGEFLGIFFVSLLYGIIFWLPTVIVLLIIEFVVIRKSANKRVIQLVLTGEAVLAFLSIWGLFGFSFHLNPELPFALAFSIILTQLFRWIYLKGKNRMYNSVEPKSILDKN